MNAACPNCGVAILPGYVKCPKCRAKLPSFDSGRARMFGAEGGTAVPDRSFPYAAVIVPVALVAAIVVYFGLVRTTDNKPARAATPPAPTIAPTQTTAPTVDTSTVPTTDAVPSGPSLSTVTGDLQRSLQRQRLWSTIEVLGSRVDVRSSSCGEPAMASLVDGVRTALRNAGATQLRCLAQSGTVIFQRDL